MARPRQWILVLLFMLTPTVAWGDVCSVEDVCNAGFLESGECDIINVVQLAEGCVLDLTTGEDPLDLNINAWASLQVMGGGVTIRAHDLYISTAGTLIGAVPGAGINIELSGRMVHHGTIDFSHPDGGGDFWVSAEGEMTVSGNLLADTSSADSTAGTIDLTAGSHIWIKSEISAKSTAIESDGDESGSDGEGSGAGGTVLIHARGGATTINIYSTIDVSGPQGGGTIMLSGAPLITVGPNPEDGWTVPDLILDGRSGGALWVTDTTNAQFNTNISADGDPSDAGNGGAIVFARVGTVEASGQISANAAPHGGNGGTLWMDTTKTVTIDSEVSLNGGGLHGSAGVVDIVSLETVTINGNISLLSRGAPGSVSIVSVDDLDSDGKINVHKQGTEGSGGSVLMASLGGTLEISEDLDVRGVVAPSDLSALVDLYACDITTTAGTKIDATGYEGTVHMTGIDTLTLNGDILAGSSISLRSRPGALTLTGTNAPEPEVTEDDGLQTCTCSAGTAPEDCRNPLDVDGDDFVTHLLRGLDCNDHDASINPAAVEVADGIDNNCDGQIDEGYDPGDTGDTGDTGVGDTGTPAVDDSGEPDHKPDPIPGASTGDEPKGCGCTAVPSPGGLAFLLALLPAAVRRRG